MNMFQRMRGFLLVLFLIGQTSMAVAFNDGIVAIVNEELITLKDLKDHIQKTYVMMVSQKRPAQEIQSVMDDLEKNGIQKLIEDRLILSYANKAGIQVRTEAVDERISAIKSQYTSEEEFLKALVAHGATLTDLRNKAEEQLKIKYILDHEINSKIKVKPQEVTDFFEAHRQEFVMKERVHLESIYIPFAGNKDLAQMKAEQALARINAGEDFLKIASEYSNTPSVGSVERGQLMPDIEEVVFNMDIGKVSPVVPVENGFFVFLLTGRTEAKQAQLPEVESLIYDIVYRQKFQERFDKWMKELKSEAYIEIK